MSRFVEEGTGIVWLKEVEESSTKSKKQKYKCWDCGKSFPESYLMMLHYDFHKGEPTVREAGCFCGQYYDVRIGYCLHCGHRFTDGWRVVNGKSTAE